MRARTNIKRKERQFLVLSDFEGVDFSGELGIRSNRASYMENFINQGGMTRKRHGWEQQLRLPGGGRVNGFFQFEYGASKHLVVYAGTGFYRVEGQPGAYTWETISLPETVAAGNMLDDRIQVFFSGGRAYIIGCGYYLVYGTWDNGDSFVLRRVYSDSADGVAYVPTTTISIDHTGVADTARAVLDGVNVLCPWRKNKLVGDVSTEENPIPTWYLDAGYIYDQSDVVVTVETTRTVAAGDGELYEEGVTYEYTNTTALNNLEVFGEALGREYLFLTKENGVAVEYEVDETGEEESQALFQKYMRGRLSYEFGKIGLYDNVPSPVAGESNITVLYCAGAPIGTGQTEIDKCRVGTVFGAEGNTNRLFLAGSGETAHMDFYSEEWDFTYFPDQNVLGVGSAAGEICGYARLSDSALGIFKKNAIGEATLYFRTGKDKLTYDAGGFVIHKETEFSTAACGATEEAVSGYAFASLAGDALMLSVNGVFGVSLSGNTVDVSRYLRERSRSINRRLVKEAGLAEAVGISFENRYYLAVNGVCYVADAGHKYVAPGSVDGDFNYEWWYFTNIPARVFAVLEGRLYFGTADGRICVFDEEYSDRSYDTDVSVSADVEANRLVVEDAVMETLKDGDVVELTTPGLYGALGTFGAQGGRAVATEQQMSMLREEMCLVAADVGDTGLAVGTPYLVRNINMGDGTFELVTAHDETVAPVAGGFSLYLPLQGRELVLCEVRSDGFGLGLFRVGGELTIARYGNEPLSVQKIKITRKRNVVAEWCTPVFDMGTNEKSKTLLKMTMALDPESNGTVRFGYDTRATARLLETRGSVTFSFDHFNFEEFTFEAAFATSHSVPVNVRNFNFIMFRFRSEDDRPLALNTFTAVYKINRENKGVW